MDLIKNLWYAWKVKSYEKLIIKITKAREKLKIKQAKYTERYEFYKSKYNKGTEI